MEQIFLGYVTIGALFVTYRILQLYLVLSRGSYFLIPKKSREKVTQQAETLKLKWQQLLVTTSMSYLLAPAVVVVGITLFLLASIAAWPILIYIEHNDEGA
ncbi:TMhelix containing protein [Vibrio phage 1.046.O._10N.286.52.E3]|nr:TMhelix containing protein [Vibrio phage 1.046.O._10N.286.52.E3]